jgi:hypothetical protein
MTGAGRAPLVVVLALVIAASVFVTGAVASESAPDDAQSDAARSSTGSLGRLVVEFDHPARAVAALGQRGERLRRPGLEQLGLHIVEAESQEIEGLRRHLERRPGILRVEVDTTVTHTSQPDDPRWPDQWGLHHVDMPGAWSIGAESAPMVVAVLDTGVEAAHPDLEGAVLPGRNVLTGLADTSDRGETGHGTSVAGIVGARANNGAGIAGVCWWCSILPAVVLDEGGSGHASDVAEGIVWATDNGADVINLSLGGPGPMRAVEAAVEYARDAGVVVVAAAGNAGSETEMYPAAYDGVVGVAATDPADALYWWSNRGSWVDLAAPGCNVSTLLGGQYGTVCGTSAATPVVAGVAAIALGAGSDPVASRVTEALRAGASPISGIRYGRLDAAEVLRAIRPGPVPKCESGTPLTGDWNGDGIENFGCFTRGRWLLHLPGGTVTTFTYGVRAGDVPVVGDWNGDGIDGPGIFRRGGEWHLRNGFSGRTDHDFTYGVRSGDVPLAGDWNGDGTDGPGIFRGGEWHLRNGFSGRTNRTFTYGVRAGDVAVVGDWNGDGIDGPGIFRRGGEWHLRYGLSGRTDHISAYGVRGGDVPVVGNWDGVGGDGMGIFRGGEWHLRNTFSGRTDAVLGP